MNETTSNTSEPNQRPDTLQVSDAVRSSVVITCASMAILVLGFAYAGWQMREFFHAFTDGDLPLMLRVLFVAIALVLSIMVIGMAGYGLAAIPVLARGRQRAIERLLRAQGWLWSMIGVSIVGMFAIGIIAKVANFLGDLWPF